MLVIKYTDDTATTVDITDRFDLTDGLTVMTSAEETSKASSQVTAQDPDDDFVISGHRGFFVHEDTAPFERIGIFFTNTRTYSRDTVWYTEGSHNVGIDLDDVNTLLSRQILHGTFDRPAETDVERIAALLATTEMSFIGDPTTYVDTTAGVAMDAVDYTGQSTQNVIQDCMDTSGRNAYAFQTFDSPDYVTAFWYKFGSDTARSSDLRITNYLPDVDADAGAGDPGSGADWTWAPLNDAELARDPTRVYSGVFANYDGGAVFRENTATALAFAHRHTVVNWPNVKSSAKAIARADRYLADINTEEDVITVTIEVPPAHVNDAREGERIECKFTHLPGYESEYTWMRILNRAVTFVTPAVYRIKYTLSAQPTFISCATVIGTLGASSTGYIDCGAPGCTGSTTFPVAAVPTSYPAVIISNCGMFNSFEGGPTSMSVASPWTEIGQYAIATNTAAEVAYQAITSGTAADEVISFSNRAFAQGLVAIGLPTAATAPVQSVTLSTSASTITLPSPPTPGNILILTRVVQVLGGGFTYGPAAVDFTQTIALGIWDSGVSHAWMDIGAHCVADGDGDEYVIAAAGSPQFQFTTLSEWEIT